MVVRMPRVERATAHVQKEHRWLQVLAPLLPLAVPTPLAVGEPGEGYPWQWAIHRWLAGENATVGLITDPLVAAGEMARFIAALQRIDTTGGPPPGAHNVNRGEPLINRDAFTRASIATLPPEFDTRAVTAAWESALRLPRWDGPPVWLHGDLQPGNLLVHKGRLSAVIDFGCLGVGDPACDLMVAWNLFDAGARRVIRAVHPVDDATWARGRGWALSVWVGGVAYYSHSHPAFADMARHTIAQVLADHRRGE
jgi:aminoglycoside phosphotransferase (APT) family kinase protein